jgi:hypothetical protein
MMYKRPGMYWHMIGSEQALFSLLYVEEITMVKKVMCQVLR